MGDHLRVIRITINYFPALHVSLLSVWRTSTTRNVAEVNTWRLIGCGVFCQVTHLNILQVCFQHRAWTSSGKIHFSRETKIIHVFCVSNCQADLMPSITSTVFRYNADIQTLCNLWENFPSPSYMQILAFIDKDKHTALTCLRQWYLSGSGSNPRSTLPGRPKLWMPAELHPVQFASSLLDKYLSLHKLKVFQDIPVETH